MGDQPIPGQDEDIFLENGRLSYENPNYQLHLNAVRLEDALNSNTEHYNLNSALLSYSMDVISPQLSNMDLGMELELARTGSSTSLSGGNATRQRRHYASLDPMSMGVDVQVGPVMNLGSPDFDNNRGVLDNYGTSVDIEQRKSTMERQCTDSSSVDTGSPSASESSCPTATGCDSEPERNEDQLPPGWEKHEDDDGPYYWHIKSGTIQREPPENKDSSSQPAMNFQRQIVREAEAISASFTPVVPRSTTSFTLSDLDSIRSKEDMAFNLNLHDRRRSFPVSLGSGVSAESRNSAPKSPAIRFSVRSLGWVEIAEEDLTPERSSKAVNRCIVDLSLGRHDLLDVVGRWGDGKDLFMDLDEGSLKLIDTENFAVLNSQPIHTIRVWGVGRDNGRERDFAYVARDRVTRKHMCHVFRCDTPARTIANTLRDICKKIMIERNLQHGFGKPAENGANVATNTLGSSPLPASRSRPSNLPSEQRRHTSKIGQILLSSQSFPTPMEEPRKVLKAQYIGSLQVRRPSGMDTLNDAIDQMASQVPADQWRDVNVAVAPSVVTITDAEDDEKIIVESRVRFLSFLGIGRQVENCGFIVHTANDVYIAHVLCCYPSSGAICKTIEAACKLRYQKCLDAHGALRGRITNSSSTAQTPTGRSLESLSATLKSVFGSISLGSKKTNKTTGES
ncbi:hypothetical protein GHT06_007975 [Daphnia sinensis]|uniref:Uncharacterized protein n=1 Tax=Daphnia sinensis TaxID=1820382 RepID=A0AAD5L187_9CRUS|nr:hypothetical protein GHT06_007975 [Daphnia sinensis]